MKTMAELSPGEWAYVGEHSHERLKQLGLTPGTKVRCLQKSPFGDPVAYEIRGTVFAVRNQDAGQIDILKKRGDAGWD